MVIASIIIAIVAALIFAGLGARRIPVKPTHAGGIVYKKEGSQTLFLIVTASGNKSKWVLPKGRIENNETPEFAAVREVMEEAAVLAKPIKKLAGIAHAKKGGHILTEYFLMSFEKNYSQSTEGRKIAWLPLDEAIEMLTSERAKNMLRQLQQQL